MSKHTKSTKSKNHCIARVVRDGSLRPCKRPALGNGCRICQDCNEDYLRTRADFHAGEAFDAFASSGLTRVIWSATIEDGDLVAETDCMAAEQCILAATPALINFMLHAFDADRDIATMVRSPDGPLYVIRIDGKGDYHVIYLMPSDEEYETFVNRGNN